MEKTGHLAFGIIFGGIYILATYFLLHWFVPMNITSIVLTLGIIYIYSLLADIDHKNSTITWNFVAASIFALIAGYILKENVYMIFGLVLLIATFVAASIFPHRGFTHSISFAILVSLPFFYFSYQYVILAFIVFYSHLVADEEYFKLI